MSIPSRAERGIPGIRPLVVVLAALLSSIIVIAGMPGQALADERAPKAVDVVTGVVVDGAPDFQTGHRYRVEATWELPEGGVVEGDYFYIDMPDALPGVYMPPFDLLTATDEVAGTCTFENGNTRVKCTFSDVLENRVEIHGTAYWQVTGKEESDKLTFKDNTGKEYTVPEGHIVDVGVVRDRLWAKAAWTDTENNLLHWSIYLRAEFIEKWMGADGKLSIDDVYDATPWEPFDPTSPETNLRFQYVDGATGPCDANPTEGCFTHPTGAGWTTLDPPFGKFDKQAPEGNNNRVTFIVDANQLDLSDTTKMYRIVFTLTPKDGKPIPPGSVFRNEVFVGKDVETGANTTWPNAGGTGGGTMPADITWRKVDASPSANALAGSEWLLTGGPGNITKEVVDNAANDADPADGSFRVVGLLPGDYQLTETAAPNGFIGGASMPVTVGDDGTVVEIGDIVNEKSPASVTWKKIDDDGAALVGSEWEVRRADGTGTPVAVAQDTPAGSGEFRADGLEWGVEYVLVETKAPLGFEKRADLPFTIDVDELDLDLGPLDNGQVPALTLPRTGGTGELPFTGIAFALAAGALGFLALGRRSVARD